MNAPASQPENCIGLEVEGIDTPALLIDAAALEANIATLSSLMRGRRQRLRPHAKTHKSPLIARKQIAAGAIGICCAKLSEAQTLASSGIDDILITTPVIGGRKLEHLARLGRSTKLSLVVDNAEAVEPLAMAADRAGRPFDVLVEVDVGQGRCGVRPGHAAAILADKIVQQRNLRFVGLQGYQGALQGIVPYAERRAAVQDALSKLLESADHVRRAGHDISVLTGGGSGSCAIDLELDGLSELQPGSYVFMDASYSRIEWDSSAVPSPFRPSLSVFTSVLSRPDAKRAIVDVGWKSAGSDSGPAVPLHPELCFEFAGDEHGCIRRKDDADLDLTLGAKLRLLPSHCDTTVNLYSSFLVIRDERVEDVWPVLARGCSR